MQPDSAPTVKPPLYQIIPCVQTTAKNNASNRQRKRRRESQRGAAGVAAVPGLKRAWALLKPNVQRVPLHTPT